MAILPRPAKRAWAWAGDLAPRERFLLIRKFGLTGLGIGIRSNGARGHMEPYIRLYVDVHRREVQVPTAIPISGQLVKCELVPFGNLNRQAFIGSSVGPDPLPGRLPAKGTIGAFGTDEDGATRVAITAMHVTGYSQQTMADRPIDMYSPSKLDNGSASPFGRVVLGTTTGIDAAKIVLDDPEHAISIMPEVGSVNRVLNLEFPDCIGTRVHLYGASSLYQEGFIVDGPTDFPLDRLVRCFTVAIATQDGDSGAGLVDSENRLLGFLVGRSSETNLAVFVAAVPTLAALRCTIP